jgi:hypothetical protein
VKTLVALAAFGALVPGGRPLVPPFVQTLVKHRAGDLAYVPTRAPSGYSYLSYTWNPRTRSVTIRVANRHFPSLARHTVAFTARRFPAPLSACANGKLKTIQYDGNRVYWDGTLAWRCVRTPTGDVVRLAATGPNLPDVALAQVVASGKRIA